MRKDEKICVDCNRKFRFKKRGRKPERCPQCAEKRHKLQMIEYMEKKKSLGTPATWDLSPKGVKRELYRIRNNIRGNLTYNPNTKSKREVVLDKIAYDEDKNELLEV